ncbi:MAG: M23 family metallopeptidase [Mariprofundaceae bacterium]|nr:M23 family metallopeptidase [Mariprofundaceae bacterium]
MPYWIIFLFLFAHTAAAQQTMDWQATQGDIIHVQIHADSDIQQLTALGKSWPFQKNIDGMTHGWIGVDLQQKIGNYPLQWHSEKNNYTEHLHVTKGEFRISRITVEKNMSSFDAAALKRIRADQQAIKNTYDIKLDRFPLFSKASMPVDGIESTPFGAQRYVNGKARSPHSGIDIAAPEGSPIAAPLAGKVLLVEDMFLNGTLIAIGHGKGLVSIYAHLHKSHVKLGEQVSAGQVIAEVGSTGRSTGPHLHWGMRFNHVRINPQSLLMLSDNTNKK